MKNFITLIHTENLNSFIENMKSCGAEITSFKKCDETIFECGEISYRAPESSYDKLKEILGEEFLEDEVE